MKLIAVGDCHGEIPELDEEEVEEAEAILAVGDFCGGGDDIRQLMFESMDEDWEWYEKMDNPEEAVKESIAEGEKVLEYLNSFGKPVLVVPGNWDWSGEIYSEWDFLGENRFQEMVDKFTNVRNVNFEAREIGDYVVIGYGPCSGPEIPQYEDDKSGSEEEMVEIRKEYRKTKKELEQLFENTGRKVIFLSHNTPHDTSLDRINNEDSPVHGSHYGSLIVRELIEEFQPQISIAGHMHEAEGIEEIGETLCINAGLNNTEKLELD